MITTINTFMTTATTSTFMDTTTTTTVQIIIIEIVCDCCSVLL